MKKLVALILVVVAGSFSVFASVIKSEKSTYEVDTKASKVYWVGKKVTGEHKGYLSIDNGQVYVSNNKIVGADVNLGMNSIECTDLTGEWKDKLIGHLKSEDFFSVEKYPNASFKITSIKSSESGQQVVGDLTIKGITHEISFPAKVSVASEKVTASGTASIDRTKWDIKYNSGSFFSNLGDNMIKDEFEIKFELEASVTETLSAK